MTVVVGKTVATCIPAMVETTDCSTMEVTLVICMKDLTKSTKALSQGNRFPGPYLNRKALQQISEEFCSHGHNLVSL
jgi:hypothetical protein